MDKSALFLSSALVASAGKVYSPGGLLVSEGYINFCGQKKEASRLAPLGTKKVELPGTVIFPGFVNAHTHLTIPELEKREGKDFVGWLLQVMGWKMGTSQEEVRGCVEESVRQCVGSGITLAGEISGSDLSHYVNSPIRVRAFLELLGMTEESWKDGREIIERCFDAHEEGDPFLRLGVSPHSLYTCNSSAVKWAGGAAFERGVPLQMHLAESLPEVEFIRTGGGEIRERIYSALKLGDGDFSGYGDRYIDLLREAIPGKASLVHVTRLSRDELVTLGDAGFGFIFCIRSNRYLSGEVPHLDVIVDGDYRFGVGTDSRGSCGQIDMFEEMRSFADSYHGSLKSKEFYHRLFDASTAGGSAVIGFSDLCGSLEEGKMADFCALELSSDRAPVLSGIIEKGERKNIREVFVSGRSVIGF